jgi:hypothetical protein
MWVGATLAFLIALIFDRSLTSEAKANFTFLVTAFVSLLSASFALGGVFANQQFQRQLDEEKLQRKAESARAFLPNALSQLAGVARNGIRHNFVISRHGRINHAVTNHETSNLLLSDEITNIFRDLIENSHDASVRGHLVEILREHQVLVARSTSDDISEASAVDSESYRHIVHWSYLYALGGTLFEYARGEEDCVDSEIKVQDLQGALRMNGIHLTAETFPLYVEHFGLYSRRYARRLKK